MVLALVNVFQESIDGVGTSVARRSVDASLYRPGVGYVLVNSLLANSLHLGASAIVGGGGGGGGGSSIQNRRKNKRSNLGDHGATGKTRVGVGQKTGGKARVCIEKKSVVGIVGV